jgi:hypothetical protein
MTANIIHPYEWSKGNEAVQNFLAVGPGRDELILYESIYDYSEKKYSLQKASSRPELESIQCYNYSPSDKGKSLQLT